MTERRSSAQHRPIIALCLLLLCLPAGGARAEIPNLAFGGKGNQVSAHVGASLRDGVENLFLAGLQYSQPNGFFRLPGRLSAELMTAHGAGGLSRYSQPLVFGFAQDVVLPVAGPVYAGVNLGIYIKSNATDRISSNFTFGERVFFGGAVPGGMRLELYLRHFSNGALTERNSGQNFAGLSVLKNF